MGVYPKRSIDLAGTPLPARVAALRRERGWSRADLAARAGLSAKVVYQIESRSRDQYLEKTLLLLAEALRVRLEDLLQPEAERNDEPVDSIAAEPPSDSRDAEPETISVSTVHRPSACSRRRCSRALALAAGVALLVAVSMVIVHSRRPVAIPRVESAGSTVQARVATSGELSWARRFQSTVAFAEPSPWSDGTVLVGLDFDAPDGGRVMLLDRKTGATLWERSPDADLAAQAFGSDILNGLGVFGPMFWRSIDLDGDSTLEIAVSFLHIRQYPASVMILDRAGEVRGEYFNRGHVYDMVAADIDGDGRQELICAGANNNTAYGSGAVFILDRDHCRGAAVDPHNGGSLEVGDGSRCRIILPSLAADVLARLGVVRICADCVMVSRDTEGATKLIVRVGHDRWVVHLQCDADLHPLAVLPTDGIRICLEQWSITDAADYGFNSVQRREQWRQRIIHFDSGRTALAAIPTL